MKRRVIALFLGMTMILSTMVGCGSQEVETQDLPKEDSQMPIESSDQATSAEESTTPEEEGVREFEWFGGMADAWASESPVYDLLAEGANVTINFNWNTADAFETVLASRVAEKDLPDVIGTMNASDALCKQLQSEGLIVPISDYLDRLPNFTRFITEADEPYLADTPDGTMYSIGYLLEYKGINGWSIRKDWLDAVDMEVPETWEEWKEVWYAFKNQDANENGDPNDEVPFSNGESSTFVKNVFGILSNKQHFSVVDGVYTYDLDHPNYMEYLDEMRQLYADGIIPKDYMEIPEIPGTVLGSTVGKAAAIGTLGRAVAEVDEDALLLAVAPPKGPHGDQAIAGRTKVTKSVYITQAAIDNGSLDAILDFINYTFSDEGILITNYGVEGETYEVVDGKPELLSPYRDGFPDARKYGITPSPIPHYITAEVFGLMMFKGQDIDDLDIYDQQRMLASNVVNNDYFYQEPIQVETELWIENAELSEQAIALGDQYIIGKISKDEFLDNYNKLKEQGLGEAIEDVQEAYNKLLGE